MKQTVLSLAPLPPELVKALILQTQGVPDFEVVGGHDMRAEDLEHAFSRADVILGDYTFARGIPKGLISHARSVKLIQQPSVGYQHIDVAACRSAGIKVANTPGANTISVAEHTVAVGLCLLRNLLATQQSMKEGRWAQMDIKPVELAGKTWGLVGLGRIGRAVALRLMPFGLAKVLYTDEARPGAEVEEQLCVEYAGLLDLLRLSDIVSLHAPLTEATTGLLGRSELGFMKPGAYLINVARGGIVDEEALAEGLTSGRVAGAAVDVFSEEPVPENNPLLTLAGNKVLLSPHVAGVSNEAAGRIINMATGNIARVLKGESPLYLVEGEG